MGESQQNDMQWLLRMLGPVMDMYIHTSRLDFLPSSCVPSSSCQTWIDNDFQGNFAPPDAEIVFESRSVRAQIFGGQQSTQKAAPRKLDTEIPHQAA